MQHQKIFQKYRRKQKYVYFIGVFVALTLMCFGIVFADLTIDNGDPGSSSIGNWSVSGGANPYGDDSLWSRDGSTYTWQFDSPPDGAGTYEVFMWYSEWRSRTTAAEVDIDHGLGSSTVPVNQQQNPGDWNSIGTYYFDAAGSVTIVASYGSSVSTCADAVWFKFLSPGLPPAAFIDSITPSPAEPGQAVTFTGHGTDDDPGSFIAAYQWESNIDDFLSNSDSFSTTDLSEGTHEISFQVQDNDGNWSEPVTATLIVGAIPTEIIIDNRDTENTSQSEPWSVSGASGPWEADSFWNRDGATFTWHFNAPQADFYEAFMWSTGWPSRTTGAQVNIENADGEASVPVNQQENVSQWYSLGVYYFEAGTVYDVTIIAQPGPSSTCADAIKFVKTTDPSGGPPVANFSADRTSAGISTPIQFYDNSTGTVEQRLWTFGDGQTSTEQNPMHSYAEAGNYTVSLEVTNSFGSDTMTKNAYIQVYAAVENIYLVDGYSYNSLFLPRAYEYLEGIGATEQGDVWIYENPAKGVTYRIFSVRSAQAMEAVLREEGAHIIYNGHSNFGLGASFGTSREIQEQQIDNVYFVDDVRFTNYSTKYVSLKVDGMKYGQAYPNWNPIFSDGTSAIAAYDFSEGTPPHNYVLTYKIPGDSTYYKIELADGSFLERFPDANTPAWYSPDGFPPDPIENREYFITNSETEYNRCDFVGNWIIDKVDGPLAGYLGYNYQYHVPGTGNNTATFTIIVKHPSLYNLMASWQPSSSNASNAKFAIRDPNGDPVGEVEVDQRTTAQFNPLGVFNLVPGAYTVQLSDDADGNVVADALILMPLDVPAELLTAEFGADSISGTAPLTVQFEDYSSLYNSTDFEAEIVSWQWDFGDGNSSIEQNPAHIYSNQGAYTVQLTVRDSNGNEALEEKEGFIVVGTTAAVHAEFTAAKRISADKTIINFVDQSSGNITSWHWDFGDGTESDDQNPLHVYTDIGAFTVTLTVTGPSGNDSETEVEFVNNIIGNEYVDNTFHTKPHFYSGSTIKFGKEIVDTGDIRIADEDLKYSRLFYGGCNSSSYYPGVLNKGIMFYAKIDVAEIAGPEYLRRYLLGDTDDEILVQLNAIENAYEYYNFNLKPPSMR